MAKAEISEIAILPKVMISVTTRLTSIMRGTEAVPLVRPPPVSASE